MVIYLLSQYFIFTKSAVPYPSVHVLAIREAVIADIQVLHDDASRKLALELGVNGLLGIPAREVSFEAQPAEDDIVDVTENVAIT